ncbi:MAG: hypothetical protein Q4C67_06600 [Deinococcus sp.]|nr:hypothetical protein [Deinococcus sp.]
MTTQTRKRGPDRQPRQMHTASLGNLRSYDRVRPEGKNVVEVKVYLTAADARAWRRLTPTERGELAELALRLREQGQ